MASTSKILSGISDHLDESMSAVPCERRARLSPVPSKKDFGRKRRHDVGSVDVDLVTPDPNQPRRQFSQEAIARLAESLRAQGQLQPIRARWCEELAKWVIVSGERRWRAAKLAGLPTIDCVFEQRELLPGQTLEQQLIENLVREDLLPIEEARAYQQLMQLKNWNGKQVSEALHIPASKVSRSLALLDLPPEVQWHISSGQLAARSAYELTKLSDAHSQLAVAEQVIDGKLTHRDTANTVKRSQARSKQKQKRKRKQKRTPGGAKVEFWAENGWKITVSSQGKGNYHHVKEALQQALDEAELRIRANIQII
jgi:ParB family chromosome partitioning protein